jgi:poly(3-hydroxybutyrate) depolymerase
VLLLMAPNTGRAQTTSASATQPLREQTATFLHKRVTVADRTFPYLLFLPGDYYEDSARHWPVIVSFHGSGECGKPDAMLTLGLPKYVLEHAATFPFIVVVPNAPTLWFRGSNAVAVSNALSETQRDYRVDLERVYLTGYSMGGFASWELAYARPDLFAAIVPICGVGSPEYAANITHLPVWAFHGARDGNVPVSGSRGPIEALRKLGAKPRYTEYPDAAHGIWDQAYATPGLFDWLSKQRLGPPPREIEHHIIGGTTRVWWLALATENGRKTPAWIKARIGENGRITVTSEGIREWFIRPDDSILKVDSDVEIVWNQQVVHRGKWTGSFGVAATTRPATAPGNE